MLDNAKDVFAGNFSLCYLNVGLNLNYHLLNFYTFCVFLSKGKGEGEARTRSPIVEESLKKLRAEAEAEAEAESMLVSSCVF